MKNFCLALFVVILASLLTLQLACSDDQDALDHQNLRQLFQQALTAEGSAYTALRDELTSHDQALPFLDAVSQGTNIHSRVLATAMLSWIKERKTNERRLELVFDVLGHAVRKRAAMLVNVQSAAFGEYAGPPQGYVQPDDDLHKPDAVPFLLELALKGSVSNAKESKKNDHAVWSRCYAAALVGGYEGADVLPVLAELLKTSESYALRACAATGLRRTGDPHAIEPLIAALSDKEEAVRRSAQLGLKEITGQDFGEDAKKYQAWWTDNKDRLLKKE